jgi:hypothetical protein
MKVTRVDDDAAGEDCDHESHGPEEENFKFARRWYRAIQAEQFIQRIRKPSIRNTFISGVARFGCAT